MKKITVLLFIMTILLSNCASNSEFKIGKQIREINNKHTPYITMNALSAYENKSNYLIVIDDGDVVQKLVQFSPERKNIIAQELDLIQCEEYALCFFFSCVIYSSHTKNRV